MNFTKKRRESMTNKAKESHLAELHSTVARVLTAQVSHKVPEEVFNADGECVETGEEVYDASPATLAAAIKFLKDNSITCDLENNEDMNQLRDTLARKQKHSRLTGSNGREAALQLVEM
jgi:hypothetical protein